MSMELRTRLFAEIDSWVLVDPHTHINPLSPAAKTLADILGYHYYTELAHSAGLPRAQIEDPGLDPKAKTRLLVEWLKPLDNTIQVSWFVELAREFFGFRDDHVTLENWEPVYDSAARAMARPDWSQRVLEKSKLRGVFLTNDFDDPLEGFDAPLYIPCLRTDELVFHLARPQVRARFEKRVGFAPSDAASLRAGIGKLFESFRAKGAKACAISLPTDFSPTKVTDAEADAALAAITQRGEAASTDERRVVAHFVFWTITQFAADFRLPFDLMIGVKRGVYAGGVYQGQDLYDSRVSLVQYEALFNAFPQVVFPISTLASVTNQELVSFAWIFPNVLTNGHWWYSNTPSFIERDLEARLEAAPKTKQIAYYSDMYKLEFALPKFAMYKRILAKTLAERFVIERNWSEDQALALGRQILVDNVERVFDVPPPA